MNSWSGAFFIAGVTIGGIYHTINRLINKIEKMLQAKMDERHILIKINSSDIDIVGNLINYTKKPVKKVPLILPHDVTVMGGGTTRVQLNIGLIIPKNMGFFIRASEKIEPLIINKSGNGMICSPGEYPSIIVLLKNPSDKVVRFSLGTIGFHLYAGDLGMFNIEIVDQ